jgi:hypothetical protein
MILMYELIVYTSFQKYTKIGYIIQIFELIYWS